MIQFAAFDHPVIAGFDKFCRQHFGNALTDDIAVHSPLRGPNDFHAIELKSADVLHLVYVEDADVLFGRAVEAGCEVLQPISDMFWGDRYGKVCDPYGHHWGIATHLEDVGEEEMARRAQEALAAMGCDNAGQEA